MLGKSTRRDFLRAAGRAAGLLGLGGLVWSALSRSAESRVGAGTARLPCERCPALGACWEGDSLQARAALGARARQASAADAGGVRRLCGINGALSAAPTRSKD
jgi:hypothetical protein